MLIDVYDQMEAVVARAVFVFWIQFCVPISFSDSLGNTRPLRQS